MLVWQNGFLLLFALANVALFAKGLYESNQKNNAFGLTRLLFFLGMFVWGDAVILGLFWCLAAFIALVLQDWILFLLIASVFWVVRSFGEIMYWINQQFSPIKRNPPNTLLGYRWFKNDSIWFVYQVVWQCMLIISIISTVYLARVLPS